jgi:ATP-dependent Lon protease
MARDTKTNNKKDQSKASIQRNRKTRGKQDDSSSDESEYDEEEDEEMDAIEYRKFISTLFPSKNMDKKVKSGEKLKKALAKDVKKNKKVVESDDEELWETDEEEEVVTKKFASNKKNKKNQKNQKKSVSNIETDSDYIPTEESSDDEDEECDDEDCGKKGSGKVNIFLTLGGDEYDDDEYEDEDEEFDEEDDTEDEDAPVSSDDEDDDDEDLDEEFIQKKCRKNTKNEKEHDNNSSCCTQTNENIKKDEDTLIKLKDIYEKDKDNKMIQECISVCEAKIKENNKKHDKKQKKHKEKNMRIFKKIIKDKNTNNDFQFYEKLDTEQQKKIIKELREINKVTRVEKPYRMTLLESTIPVRFKAAAMKKINTIRNMDPGSGEYYKNKQWIDAFMRIPFDKFDKLPISIDDGIEKCHDFMENARKILDDAVYGLNDAKMQIMQMTGQLIANPKSIGCAIGIYGPPGTGKTSLIKDGIAKILGRKTVFIGLGGVKDSSKLTGHSITYEGSVWGDIVQGLLDNDSSSVVFVFDEVDKLSQTQQGDEITGVLTHLIDSTQNNKFHDNYFSEIDFDLSKCLFIFSYNDESLVNPILRDRMYRIKTDGYDEKQKTVISTNYLLPKIRDQVKFNNDDIIIPDSAIHYMIEKYCEKEDGVRNLKRCLEIIHTKLNLYRLMKPGSNLFEKDMSLKVVFPFTVTNEIVDKLIKKNDKTGPATFNSMYM